MIDYTLYRSILCLNGELPTREFFDQLRLPVIAADGAANTLMKMGITPEWVIGDLDSIESQHLETLNTVHCPDQNSCDFQKSLVFLEEKGLLPAIITGVHGGDLDHILKNVGLIAGSNNLLVAPPIMGFSMRAGEKKTFSLPLNTKLSLIGLPSAVVSSQGLQWELDHYEMQFPGVNSFYNRTVKNILELTVFKGTVLFLVYNLE